MKVIVLVQDSSIPILYMKRIYKSKSTGFIGPATDWDSSHGLILNSLTGGFHVKSLYSAASLQPSNKQHFTKSVQEPGWHVSK